MNSTSCKHYAGLGFGKDRKTHCRAGICYRDVTPNYDAAGVFLRLPCLTDGSRGEKRGVCSRFILPTREELSEQDKEMEAFMERSKIVNRAIEPYRKRVKETKQGVRETIECPACKGQLHFSIAGSNGHARVNCETPNCVRWIE